MSPKNQIYRPLIVILLTAIVLCTLRFVPPCSIGGYELKVIDPLSDLLRDSTDLVVSETHNLIPQKKRDVAAIDSCPPGMTCIIDYGVGTPASMTTFYQALTRRSEMNRPVRIAYFGDSFIEGDILTADLRALLQQQFGGCGAGYLDIAPPFPGFRTSVNQRFDGWDARCVLDKGHYSPGKLGISLRYALGHTGSWTEVRASDKYAGASRFETATIYLASNAPVHVRAEHNGGHSETLISRGDGRLEALTVGGDSLRQVRWTVESGGTGAVFYGMAAEGRDGISVDNFSLRGSSGVHLAELSEAYLQSLNRLRPYDLIVIQYGLNVASSGQKDYSAYVGQMQRVIGHLKQAFPQTAILVVSVGDRETKVGGELHTMPGVRALIDYQEQLAALSEVAFWNLYEAMGGDGSIVNMSRQHPEEARKDYTHITKPGGRRLARLLFRTIIHGYDTYRQNNNQ